LRYFFGQLSGSFATNILKFQEAAMSRSDTTPENRIENFEEFWPFYVREHSHPLNRLLHFIGSTLALICLAIALVAGNLWLIPVSFIIGYAFAWVGHFFVERNRPATFKYPLWSFRADWKMWGLMLTGQMVLEVRRAADRT